MRRIGFGTKALPSIGFVVLAIALEPLDVAVAFEGQNVGRDASDEPAIMGDDIFRNDCGQLRGRHEIPLPRILRVSLRVTVARLESRRTSQRTLRHTSQLLKKRTAPFEALRAYVGSPHLPPCSFNRATDVVGPLPLVACERAGSRDALNLQVTPRPPAENACQAHICLAFRAESGNGPFH
jgi:hypothetical protein